jgi:asparagine synthase (glutamine-hydrolysing)
VCGITGFFKKSSTGNLFDTLKSMSSLIEHRGPDQYGEFKSVNSDLYLAHQRLSIIDLTDAGKQPMPSVCGRYIIAFNGEIYNFEDLRSELQLSYSNIYWRGHSDTEVLIECIAKWGVKKTLSKLNGMFAFTVYDITKNTLIFARDRFGEKPLYIYSNSDSFAFSSELKPIEIFTTDLTINASAVDAQLKYSYIPAPYTIYQEVFKLLPGHSLEVNLNDFKGIHYSDSKPYWNISDVVDKGIKNRSEFNSIEDAIVETERVLSNSVKQRMVSDVPLGAFLSGGIDSTCITALMQKNSRKKVKTFSIGFNDENYNEAQHAKAVANVLGTEHYEMYLDPNDMLDFVPKLSEIYDEPFADSSQLPTLMVSKFAKQHVTVALTGDSGDEVFCGYNRYSLAPKLINKISAIPTFIRGTVGSSLASISPDGYRKITDVFSKLIPKLKKYKRVGDNVHKLARIIDFNSEADLYKKLILTWPETAVTAEIHDISTDIQQAFNYKGISLEERMMWQDAIGYMQNDILTKVDRASMAVSLETRVPFLDNEVYQHAWSLPLDFKLHQGITKFPLRKIISKYIPDEIMNRPKAGFAVPIDSWLRNELRPWAESLLSEVALQKSGLLDVNIIRNTWHLHLSKQANMQLPLWNVLMFQQWLLRK